MADLTNNGATSTIFVDSNIWLYAFLGVPDDADELAKHRQAVELLLGKSGFLLSVQVVNEVCYQLHRRGIASESHLQALIRSFFHRHRVHGLTQDILLSASDLRTRYSFSFWDSLIVAAALKAGAAVLYTEDMQHGLVVDGQLTLQNPFQHESD